MTSRQSEALVLTRKISSEIADWKRTCDDKALLVTGPRQVGKSYAIRDFGQRNYESYIELNLYENARACEALSNARDASDFIARVTLLSGRQIVPGGTLVFVDEIQEAPDIMTMAKFLVEDGRCDWAFSGSMLGAEFKGVRSYPVGSVHELPMYPLDFEEFCWAVGVTEDARESIRAHCAAETPVEDYIHDAMLANFRTYLVVGGMPEVVQRFLDTEGDLSAVRSLQTDLNRQYRYDISKYAGSRALQVQGIFDQLPVQLEGDTRRFVLSSIDSDARFQKYQRDFVWLVNAGVALKVDLVSEPKSPLFRAANPGKFKLYQSDTGMLMARYPLAVAQAAYLDDKNPNLGGLYENAIAQQLVAQGIRPFYYQTRKRGEVDFVVDAADGNALPIEVKSGRYYHAHAALDNVLETEGYGVRTGVVLSRGNVERSGKTLYLPLYAAPFLSNFMRGETREPPLKLKVRRV